MRDANCVNKISWMGNPPLLRYFRLHLTLINIGYAKDMPKYRSNDRIVELAPAILNIVPMRGELNMFQISHSAANIQRSKMQPTFQ